MPGVLYLDSSFVSVLLGKGEGPKGFARLDGVSLYFMRNNLSWGTGPERDLAACTCSKCARSRSRTGSHLRERLVGILINGTGRRTAQMSNFAAVVALLALSTVS